MEAAFDEITFQVDPQTEARVQGIPSLTAEVLFYAAREAIRNAARHGRNEEFDRPLHLHIEVSWHPAALAPTDNFKPGSPTAPEVSMEHGEIEIAIKDNGVGMRSTSGPTGGSGQGLAFHSTMMAVVGGTLAVESVSNVYTHVSLILPSTAW